MNLKTTALIAGAVLTLSLPATAQYPGQGRGYGSHYPSARQMDRVAEIAHHLDDVANNALAQYESNNRRPDRREAWVRNNLEELAQRASQFHDSVESYRQSPQSTDQMFNDLLRTYDRVQRSLSRIASRPYIDRSMVEVSDSLTELSRYYGRSIRPWARYDRGDHRSYDNDRYPGRH
jgi:hypothetical protein